MHHIYHTLALVLDSRNSGEANKKLVIFTRELGMIRATVQGIRFEKSKLRFALSDYSLAQIDLVRGRDVWRVTSAKPKENFSLLMLSEKYGDVARNLIRLVLRLYHGEESHRELFDHVLETLKILKEGEISETDLKHFEILSVLRIIYHLGYLAQTGEHDVFVKSPISSELIKKVANMRTEMLNEINRSLRESHL